ncbi:hypothetical protein O3G_MSEX012830 [Manduca sexta]|uniref:Uncharacterized protein n=1 Tax=Manduca sexta TaxID=7130 RepID=A0A921ZPT9_MANSE|nr:hypothetical protein O3G_MSEX012830 [Manduca sexta]KAG6461747.1 hypothetical protein O3G_MSEX012830 [Manduca sexta]
MLHPNACNSFWFSLNNHSELCKFLITTRKWEPYLPHLVCRCPCVTRPASCDSGGHSSLHLRVQFQPLGHYRAPDNFTTHVTWPGNWLVTIISLLQSGQRLNLDSGCVVLKIEAHVFRK